MGTKKNPGYYDCYDKAEDDEPMFTLLARDPMAPALVRLWADSRGVLDPNCPPDKLREARVLAVKMEEWKRDHPDHGFPRSAIERDRRAPSDPFGRPA